MNIDIDDIDGPGLQKRWNMVHSYSMVLLCAHWNYNLADAAARIDRRHHRRP